MVSALCLLLATSRSHVESFEVRGVRRQAIVVIPDKNVGPAPLVFAFHGHGGSMNNADRTFSVEDQWPDAIVVYPQGLPSKGKTDPEGVKNGWQQNAADNEGRDLAFFDAMLATLRKEYRVDPTRIYAMGHSNGGRFTYLLWAERGDTFAAVAPSASPAVLPVRKLKPIPAFIVAGREDQIVPFRNQQLSINLVRRALKTDPDKAKVDGYASIEPGPGGIELGTYIHPGTHTFPRESVPMIVGFFKRHHK